MTLCVSVENNYWSYLWPDSPSVSRSECPNCCKGVFVSWFRSLSSQHHQCSRSRRLIISEAQRQRLLFLLSNQTVSAKATSLESLHTENNVGRGGT